MAFEMSAGMAKGVNFGREEVFEVAAEHATSRRGGCPFRNPAAVLSPSFPPLLPFSFLGPSALPYVGAISNPIAAIIYES